MFRTAGQVLGVSLGGAILQAVLLQKLRARIHGPNSEEVREHIFILPSVSELFPALKQIIYSIRFVLL